MNINVIIALGIMLMLPGCGAGKAKPVKEPCCAGTWYPGEKKELDNTISNLLASSKKAELNGTVKALIVPHAGYQYSGQIAAAAFKQLKDDYETVFLLGPSHKYPLKNISILDASYYKTPLGLIKLSKKASEMGKEKIASNAQEAYNEEHSLEIELPFLQKALAKFELVPMLVGETSPDELKKSLISKIGKNDLVVVSVDLSHFHNYNEAKKLDSYSINSILSLDDEGILMAEIDAPWAVSTLLKIAREKKWKPVLLSYANSGDVAGQKDSVVGYSAFAFIEEPAGEAAKVPEDNASRTTHHRWVACKALPCPLNQLWVVLERAQDTTNQLSGLAVAKPPIKNWWCPDTSKKGMKKKDREFLLKLARSTLETYLKTGKEPAVNEKSLPKSLKEEKGCFVTLQKHGELRGCIGHIYPQEPLYKAVISNAISAAVNDTRFMPVTYDELKEIDIEISVLSVPEKLKFSSGDELKSKLRPLVDGVVLKKGIFQSTFLPQVWEQLPDKEDFLSHLCTKGGMANDCWKDTKTEVFTYQAEVFGEKDEYSTHTSRNE